jgi:hypothetical protein
MLTTHGKYVRTCWWTGLVFQDSTDQTGGVDAAAAVGTTGVLSKAVTVRVGVDAVTLTLLRALDTGCIDCTGRPATNADRIEPEVSFC